MSRAKLVLSRDPSPDSVQAVREYIAERLAAGAQKSRLARSADIEPRTFAAFVDNPKRIPAEDTWLRLRNWYSEQTETTRPPEGDSHTVPTETFGVALAAEESRRASLQETLRVQREILAQMRKGIEAQERIVDRLSEAITEAIARESVYAVALRLERERDVSPPPEPMDEVTAAAVAASDPTRTAAEDAPPAKRKRGSAGG